MAESKNKIKNSSTQQNTETKINTYKITNSNNRLLRLPQNCYEVLGDFYGFGTIVPRIALSYFMKNALSSSRNRKRIAAINYESVITSLESLDVWSRILISIPRVLEKICGHFTMS